MLYIYICYILLYANESIKEASVCYHRFQFVLDVLLQAFFYSLMIYIYIYTYIYIKINISNIYIYI
jgi:hypothetical protein